MRFIAPCQVFPPQTASEPALAVIETGSSVAPSSQNFVSCGAGARPQRCEPGTNTVGPSSRES